MNEWYSGRLLIPDSSLTSPPLFMAGSSKQCLIFADERDLLLLPRGDCRGGFAPLNLSPVPSPIIIRMNASPIHLNGGERIAAVIKFNRSILGSLSPFSVEYAWRNWLMEEELDDDEIRPPSPEKTVLTHLFLLFVTDSIYKSTHRLMTLIQQAKAKNKKRSHHHPLISFNIEAWLI